MDAIVLSLLARAPEDNSCGELESCPDGSFCLGLVPYLTKGELLRQPPNLFLAIGCFPAPSYTQADLLQLRKGIPVELYAVICVLGVLVVVLAVLLVVFIALFLRRGTKNSANTPRATSTFVASDYHI
jgi:hypothetical protein